MRRVSPISIALVAAFAVAGLIAGTADTGVDLRAFWNAGSPKDAAKAAERLVRDGVDFDAAWQRLKQGRTYGRAPTGRRTERLRVGTDTFDNAIEIPADYDPARRWQVRVQLHGGINRPDPNETDAPSPRRRQGTQNRLAGENQIYIFPAGWADAAWWHPNQVENILTLLDQVKRRYNVDESRVYLTGTSDGGTGVYYLALREPTPWSACLPLIGNIRVLPTREARADGELFVGNLANRPFFVINAVNDPLYPALMIEPYVDLMREAGVSVIFRPQPAGGHDTSWWPQERPVFERFVHDHPRAPYPESLSWETERTDRANRVHWLVIDALGAGASDVPLQDHNTFSPRYAPDFGARANPKADAGTRLADVVAGSDADVMGLRKDDRFVSIDGAAVRSGDEIGQAMQRHPGGRPIEIVVERKSGRAVLTGKFPPEAKTGPRQNFFNRTKSSGRVDVVRRGNTIEANTRGVREFTLLLSPDVFDFSQPMTLIVNGRAAEQHTVAKSAEVLLKWAARDNDRTMLYGAELKVRVP